LFVDLLSKTLIFVYTQQQQAQHDQHLMMNDDLELAIAASLGLGNESY
jgi:hypothetical protein